MTLNSQQHDFSKRTKNMITRKQYDEALSICKQYKQQLINEIESVSTQMRESDIDATIGDLKYKGKGKGISTRLMNQLYTFNAIHKIANSPAFAGLFISKHLQNISYCYQESKAYCSMILHGLYCCAPIVMRL